MGDLFGQKSAKRAAKEQAKAIREQARLAAIQSNYAADAAAQQMTLATQQRSEQRKAEDLLSRPMESATVDLSAGDDDDDDGDLLKRRRPVRQTYQSSQAGLVT